MWNNQTPGTLTRRRHRAEQMAAHTNTQHPRNNGRTKNHTITQYLHQLQDKHKQNEGKRNMLILRGETSGKTTPERQKEPRKQNTLPTKTRPKKPKNATEREKTQTNRHKTTRKCTQAENAKQHPQKQNNKKTPEPSTTRKGNNVNRKHKTTRIAGKRIIHLIRQLQLKRQQPQHEPPAIIKRARERIQENKKNHYRKDKKPTTKMKNTLLQRQKTKYVPRKQNHPQTIHHPTQTLRKGSNTSKRKHTAGN